MGTSAKWIDYMRSTGDYATFELVQGWLKGQTPHFDPSQVPVQSASEADRELPLEWAMRLRDIGLFLTRAEQGLADDNSRSNPCRCKVHSPCTHSHFQTRDQVFTHYLAHHPQVLKFRFELFLFLTDIISIESLDLNAGDIIRIGNQSRDPTLAQFHVSCVNTGHNIEILRNAKVLAATTSGAAMNKGILQSVQPRIVIVEEAADMVEAHILTSLSSGCEHLIMIGDHQQLGPKPAVERIGREYGLFERLINNGFPKVTLELQHRMRPEISALLRAIFYPNLRDHPSVARFPRVPGLTKSLFAYSHKGPESTAGPRDTSRKNVTESAVAARLALHLVYQGYDPTKITILTGYYNQESQLRTDLANQPLTESVEVTTVDKYRTEQNDIVILSLVRTCGNVGFMGYWKRVCVSLSRARVGLYILGDMEFMARQSRLWGEIAGALREQDAMGDSFPLKCRFHGTVQNVKTPEDFHDMSPDGGCRRLCGDTLACGHKCERRCHADNREHADTGPCPKECLKMCLRGHRCYALCKDQCPPCQTQVYRELPCGHTKQALCSTPTRLLTCQERCNKKCARDIHDCPSRCGVPCPPPPCTQPVRFHLHKCGHHKTAPCNSSSEQRKCLEPCNRKCKPRGHPCTAICWAPCPPCTRPVRLCSFNQTGHDKTAPCYAVDQLRCLEPCQQKCEGRKHTCPAVCGDKCPPCTEKCRRMCKRSLHHCKGLCKDPCPPCKELYKHTFPCGHNKEEVCMRIPAYECIVPKRLPRCNHSMEMPCQEDPSKVRCLQHCEFNHPNARRRCQLSCNDCWVRRNHSAVCLCQDCRKWAIFKAKFRRE